VDYFVSRDGQQYGPYTLADLQRYAASGEISLADLATSEALTEPVPVGQIIGNIAAPAASTIGVPIRATDAYPDPPNLHWGLVLLFSVLTCGIFVLVWEIVLAFWVKKVDPESKSVFYYGGAVLALVGVFIASYLHALNPTSPDSTGILKLVYYVTVLFGRFNLKSSLERHFNGPEKMGLYLHGVMTFFFGGLYFQYHMNDIVRRKAADRVFEAAR
jgi:hypothetical protein